MAVSVPSCSPVCRHALVALLLVGAATTVESQVIPGQSGFGHDSRSELAVYHAQVREELMTMVTHWAGAWEKRDTSQLAAHYLESSRSLIAGSVVARGATDAIGSQPIALQLARSPLGGGRISVTFDDMEVSGDLAMVSATMTFEPTPTGGPAVTTSARVTFAILRDDRGRWHIRSQSIVIP